MKNCFSLLLLCTLLCSCAETQEDKAAALMSEIQQLYDKGHYRATLDSIMALRKDYPEAVKARKAALKIWQNASLHMAQSDVATTDSTLQATLTTLQTTEDLRTKNLLRVRCDSLKARYEAMCGVVRMIHYRQQHP